MKEHANSLKKEGNENFKSGGNSILGAVRYPSPPFPFLVVCRQRLASILRPFPLQYLIACSMQIWKGKAWEIWSRG